MAARIKGTALISDPDEESLGPAMRDLNAAQRRFVMAVIEYPGITQSKAAQLAGYSNVKEGAKVRGHELAHNERVLAAIHEVASKSMRFSAVLAANVLTEIAGDERLEAKDRLKAAGMLLDRIGFGAAQTINVNKTVTDRTGAGMLERIKALASGLGIDPQKLLGGNAVVDAEFSEVPDAK